LQQLNSKTEFFLLQQYFIVFCESVHQAEKLTVLHVVPQMYGAHYSSKMSTSAFMNESL